MKDTGKLIPLSEVHPVSDKKPSGRLLAWDGKLGDWVESKCLACAHDPFRIWSLIVDNGRLLGVYQGDGEFSEGGGI